MDFVEETHLLSNISKKELKKENVKGIIWHCMTDYYGLYMNPDAYTAIEKKNKETKDYGFHYLISQKYIGKLVDEKYQINNLPEKQTYISNNLFNGKPQEHCISILCLFKNDIDFEMTEKSIIKKTVELLKEYNLTAKDVWRGFDLSKDSYSPFHMLDQKIFEKYIKEIEKFVPPKEEDKPSEKPEDKPEKPDSKPEDDKTIGDKIVDGIKDVANAIQKDVDKPKDIIIPPKYDDIVSPFKEPADEAKLTVNEYIDKIYKDNKGKEKEYASKFQPWDKDLEAAKKSTNAGEIKNRTYKTGNQLQYKITEKPPEGNCDCKEAYDNMDANETTKQTMVEPIYPDLITPPGEQVTIANGDSGTFVPSNSNAPLSVEEFEKRQKRFSFDNFESVNKTTIGRPINCDDEFPVDEQIKKLEQHFPKVKVDKIHFNFDEDNHPGSQIGRAMANNYAMCYDMVTEVAKRTETRLVKLENNLSTVMRYLFRLSSRMQINCVYYGGQSVYGKYKCIRCLKDDRVDDGAIVTVDQCLNCTRYEPILGQVYAILDEAGTNVTQTIDDMQLAYMNISDYNAMNKIEAFPTSPLQANLKKDASKTPKPFSEGKWKDTDKEIKAKGKKPEDAKKKDYKNGFVMDWTPTQLETHTPSINKYKLEDKKLNKEEANKQPETQGIDREIYIDTKEDNTAYEQLEFDIKDYIFEDFGTEGDFSSDGSGGDSFGMGSAEARKKIVEYMEKVKKKSEQGKVYYDQGRRYQYGDPDKMDKIDYYDCSSLVGAAYKYAGIPCLTPGYTGSQYPQFTKKQGGILIPIKDIKKALPGDVVTFGDGGGMPTTQEGVENFPPGRTQHTGIYVGDGKYLDIGRQHPNPKDNVKYKPIQNYDKRILAFGRPAALVKLDNEAGSGATADSWNRKAQGISDALWNRAKVADSNVSGLLSNMKKYNYKDILVQECKKAGFDPYFIGAIIAIESSGNPLLGGAYPGLMQSTGSIPGSSPTAIRNQISHGCKDIRQKANWLKKFGWTEKNMHVLATAHNCGQYGLTDALGFTHETHPRVPIPMMGKKCPLNTVKVPEVSEMMGKYVAKYQPSWSRDEKETYATKVLRAYNLLYSKKALG